MAREDAETGGEEYPKEGHPVFVVQKHRAKMMHYDFRLEVGGVLKSWAVPKGPSMDPAEKRLAIPTEDHDMGYAGFEGVVPEGEYGAGAVMLWDRGTYRNLTEGAVSMEEALSRGRATVDLHGIRLRGAFTLIRTRGGQWLLVKKRDTDAIPGWSEEPDPRSVASGKTLEEIGMEQEER
ncbi:MAG: DNA polymerase ligase N-terminal domain-containing protein [Methanomicrobiales archaeon]|nr:DNA polymerase ligase N-terminal domain-containing protein [Methanomicrobiales archaeon]